MSASQFLPTGAFLPWQLVIPVATKTDTSYTLQAADDGYLLRFTSSLIIHVIAPNNLPVGFECIIKRSGSGQVGLEAGTGATLNTATLTPTPSLSLHEVLSVICESNPGGAAAQYAVT